MDNGRWIMDNDSAAGGPSPSGDTIPDSELDPSGVQMKVNVMEKCYYITLCL